MEAKLPNVSAVSSVAYHTDRELQALQKLKSAGCLYAPEIMGFVHDLQPDDLWVPGGYVDFILLKKLPGVTPTCPWKNSYGMISREEFFDFCKCFMEAWE